jgi:hypothetical protein
MKLLKNIRNSKPCQQQATTEKICCFLFLVVAVAVVVVIAIMMISKIWFLCQWFLIYLKPLFDGRKEEKKRCRPHYHLYNES